MKEKSGNIKSTSPQGIQEDTLIEWIAPEYQHREKNSDWFWYLASGVLLTVTIAILMRNFLFMVFIIVATFAVTLSGVKKPRKIKFSVNARGIKIENNLHPYKEIGSFWINYDPPEKKELIIKFKNKFTQHIKIPISDIDPNSIRNYLLKLLPEEEYQESLIETITEQMGF